LIASKGGIRIKHRTCTNPHPKFGGLPCVGSDSDTSVCNDNPCPSTLLDLLLIDQSAHIPSTIRMKEYMNTELNEKILSENNCGILFHSQILFKKYIFTHHQLKFFFNVASLL
jgi:hypothetical protein